MNLRSVIYITAKEVRASLLDNKNGFEDENNVTTNTGNDSEPDFDHSNDNEFDPILGTDYNTADNNIEVD